VSHLVHNAGAIRPALLPEVSLDDLGALTQLHLDKKSGKLYSSDREGMRVMCANLDGSQVKPLARSVRCACAPCAEPRATCSV